MVKIKCKLPTGFQMKLQKAPKSQNNPKKEEQEILYFQISDFTTNLQ